VTATVTALDSSFNDGATSTHTVTDPTAQLGSLVHGPMRSGNFACSASDLGMQVMMHFDGSTINNVFAIGAAPTKILAALPDFGTAFGGAFVFFDTPSVYTVFIDETPGDAMRVTGGPYSFFGSGVCDPASVANFSAHGIWTFDTGPVPLGG
jgi:hypothetical protein